MIEIKKAYFIFFLSISFVIGGFIINFDNNKQLKYDDNVLDCLGEYEEELEQSNQLIYYVSSQIESPDEYLTSSEEHLEYIFDILQNNWPSKPICDSYDF